MGGTDAQGDSDARGSSITVAHGRQHDKGPATRCHITDLSVASYMRGKVWRRDGNTVSRDRCRVKEAVREGSDDSDRIVNRKGKRSEGVRAG